MRRMAYGKHADLAGAPHTLRAALRAGATTAAFRNYAILNTARFTRHTKSLMSLAMMLVYIFRYFTLDIHAPAYEFHATTATPSMRSLGFGTPLNFAITSFKMSLPKFLAARLLATALSLSTCAVNRPTFGDFIAPFRE